MLTIVGCLTEKHDPWLVIIAAIVCISGSWATIRLYGRAAATTALEKGAWVTLISVVAGAAIWCTHFIAMLGFSPGTASSFDPVLTISSLLVSMAGAAFGFAISLRRASPSAPALGGALVGLAIAAMHYCGMLAYRVQGIVSWDMTYLIASIAASVAFSMLALHAVHHARPRSRAMLASALLVTSIVSLHFTGMAAFQVAPLVIDASYSNPEAVRALAVAVAGVALVVVAAGLASNMIDHRARAEASEALRIMSNGLLMVTAGGIVQLYNTRMLELFGLTARELAVGMKLSDFLRNAAAKAGFDEGRTRRILADYALWMGQASTTRVEHHLPDGKILSVVFRAIENGGALITYDDVTEAREGQKRIAHMAFHDALTGLPNRRSFTEELARLAEQSSFFLLTIDLDRFKAVNDTLGHTIGDQVLVEVAQRLRSVCGPSGTLFRLGGDELAVLCPSDGEAEQLARNLIAAAALPFSVAQHSVSIGCSIGLAFAERSSDATLVQQMSDLALYKAKEAGRGRVETYRDGMIEEVAQRHRIERELLTSVESGQLELYYQPLYDLPSRALSGFEALLRWHHPERGMVPPAEFIPIAEQTGAIIPIGDWVLDAACRQAAAWPSNIYVSINVSPVQLRAENFSLLLAAALARHGVSPRQIEIELTETAMVDNSKQIAATLGQLRALGIRIAMDDFGTGYSSLAHLREFELDRIKIDRSFISTSQTDHGAAAVVRAVTSMAKELSIATTGEGVENEEQLSNLVALGCDTAQGYLLGRPLKADAATELLAKDAARKAA